MKADAKKRYLLPKIKYSARPACMCDWIKNSSGDPTESHITHTIPSRQMLRVWIRDSRSTFQNVPGLFPKRSGNDLGTNQERLRNDLRISILEHQGLPETSSIVPLREYKYPTPLLLCIHREITFWRFAGRFCNHDGIIDFSQFRKSDSHRRREFRRFFSRWFRTPSRNHHWYSRCITLEVSDAITGFLKFVLFHLQILPSKSFLKCSPNVPGTFWGRSWKRLFSRVPVIVFGWNIVNLVEMKVHHGRHPLESIVDMFFCNCRLAAF